MRASIGTEMTNYMSYVSVCMYMPTEDMPYLALAPRPADLQVPWYLP